MGINNEYGSDAFEYEVIIEPDEFQDDDEFLLDPESWHDWHSEHLLNMWMSIRQYLEENYLTSSLMTQASFHDFCEFVRNNSE